MSRGDRLSQVGSGVTDASALNYTPDVSGDWPEGVPAFTADALDTLAARTAGFLPVTVYKATDTDRSLDIVPSADPDLTFALAASSVYVISGTVSFVATTAAPDVQAGFASPGDATRAISMVGARDMATQSAFGLRVVTASDVITQPLSANTRQMWIVSGVIATNTAGDLDFIWAQNNSNATPTTCEALSYLQAIKIA